jgi:hypothetical protein
MSYKETAALFQADLATIRSGNTEQKTKDALAQEWLLRLLFEIHGDLDSLVVAYRELVKMQKERAR